MDKTDIPGTFNAGATLGPVNETNMARIWNKHKQSNTPLKRKVFVGLSGGVDSSVSAALLKNAATPKDFEKIFGRPSPEGFRGYDVTGVFIKVWHEDTELTRKGEHRTDAEREMWRTFNFSGCTAADDRLDAMRVCAKLRIPFMELDLTKEYKREVVDYMIREYKAGKTPNPDVMCNRFIKFGGFYRWAMANGADFIATGHYAQVRYNYDRTYMVKTGTDSNKDQTYFLWQIRREQLPHILFPVGGMKKSTVRKLAKKMGLITADKKDSQGLCFIGKLDMKEFLKHYIKEKSGRVLNEKGTTIGEHRGAFFYTLGERITVDLPSLLEGGIEGGWYVIAKDMEKNSITVSQKSKRGNLGGMVTEIEIGDYNWLAKPVIGKSYGARTRYRQPLQRARIMKHAYGIKENTGNALSKSSIIHNSRFIIRFASSQTVAPGQSLVLYDGDICLGGGIIA